MVTGVLGAVAQIEVRRLLAFHIVSQIGYLLMGLGIFTAPALAATIFFMLHVILAKSALFMVSGAAQRLLGTYDLRQSGGLYQSAPVLAALFLIPALALAGLPPFSGFFAKLALVQAGLDAEQYAIVGVSLAVSILTLFSMTKIWAEAYWKPAPASGAPAGSAQPLCGWLLLLIPSGIIGGLTVVMGLAAEPFFALSMRAAEQLVDSRGYIEAVLGATAMVE
jgi:multicomponent Na+:H+ antiporter subunit D